MTMILLTGNLSCYLKNMGTNISNQAAPSI